MERRKLLLAARWKAIERVFEEVRRRAVEGERYVELLRAIAGRHASEGAIVRLSREDTERYGGSLGVKVGEPVGISGGALVETGRQVLDYSLDEALAAVRAKMASELDRMLLSGASADS